MKPVAAHAVVDASQCPLCGEANHCQCCTTAAHKGPCWCVSTQIPDDLLARVPAEARRQACICQRCVTAFHREQAKPLPPRPGDFYFDKGLMVFVEAYHLRRGYCCGSGCRHCPYPK